MKNKTYIKGLRKLIIVLALVCSISNLFAFDFSKDVKISILTCAQGSELYSLFGHTAIRIQDSDKDVVFNYGTFDFNTPDFYYKYVKGLLPYKLSAQNYSNFINSYQEEKRTVYSQTLDLDNQQKQEIIKLLTENYKPENKYYLYNFLYDNCTTRVRDIIQKAIPYQINWSIKMDNKNFWNLLDEYLNASPWAQWGIHSILGQHGKNKPTIVQKMFLPDYLMEGINFASYKKESEIRPIRLSNNAEILYKAPQLEKNNNWYFHPIFIFIIFSIIFIVLYELTRKKWIITSAATIIYLFTTILGLLIIFLGGFTAHPMTAPNWNILWAIPLNICIIPFLYFKKIPIVIQWYLLLYSLILLVSIPLWFILMPALPLATFFLLLFTLYLNIRLYILNYNK